jgi:DNA polymerase III subunit beta
VAPASVHGMTPELDLTAATTALAAAAMDVVRLLPGRPVDPVLAGMLVEAGRDGVVLAGTDAERAVRPAGTAVSHVDGRVLVPARPLAETLRALDAGQVRLTVEGARLAVRTPGARFALPLLDVDLHPGVPAPPRPAGEVDAGPFASALAVVVAAASRDEALPLFTGVHVRSDGDRLTLVSTDRYRMAVAHLPWRPAVERLDVLVPAALLAEVARQAPAVGRVTLHADGNRAALAWDGTAVSTAVLDAPFPDESRHLARAEGATVELDADALAGAVRRVSLYVAARGVLSLELGDAEVRVRGADERGGEAEETVKADVRGGRADPSYQARYLVDALRPFAGGRVRLDVQARRTVFARAEDDPAGVSLRYVVAQTLSPGTR